MVGSKDTALRLVLATNNKDKVVEMREALEGLPHLGIPPHLLAHHVGIGPVAAAGGERFEHLTLHEATGGVVPPEPPPGPFALKTATTLGASFSMSRTRLSSISRALRILSSSSALAGPAVEARRRATMTGKLRMA